MMIEQENKPAKYLCHVKKRDKYHISNRGNICLKFVTNGAKAKRGFIAKYSQSKQENFTKKILKIVDITRVSTSEIQGPI